MIKLIVNNQELSIVTQKVVSGTHDYLTVEADFKGSTWDGLRKWVHFSMGEFNYIMPMLDDAIAEDMHLDLTEGTWEVYVHGNLVTDDEVTERITTDIKYLYVDAPHDGHPFPPLTPDYEELLANQVAEAKEISAQLRKDAEAGLFADGATFYPDVDEDGIISWTNDKGRENPEPKNIRGPQGLTGESGVYIGTDEPTDPDIVVWIDPNADGGTVVSGIYFGEDEPESDTVAVWIKPNALVGKMIVSQSKTGTGAPGTRDTYTINFTDGSSLDIIVYNGADGEGAGDMVKAAYDPTNKNQDIFAYADGIKGKTDVTGILKGDGTDVSAATPGEDYVAPGGLAAVATSGSYNDLRDKPAIPTNYTVDTALSNTSENPVQNKVIKQAIDGIETRPNPNALTINVTGSTPVVYDGSAAKTVNIDTSSSGGGTELLRRTISFPNPLTFAANGGMQDISLDVSYNGYTPIAVAGIFPPQAGTISTIPIVFYVSGNLFIAEFGNMSAQQITSTFYGQAQILYKKNS